MDIIRIDLDADGKKFLPLAAVDGEDAVRRNAAERFGVIVIRTVNRILILLFGTADQTAVLERILADPFADVSVVRHALGKDVRSAPERRVGVGNALFGVDKAQRLGSRVGLFFLRPEQLGEWASVRPPQQWRRACGAWDGRDGKHRRFR